MINTLLVVWFMLASPQGEIEKKIKDRQAALTSTLKTAKTIEDQNDVADGYLLLSENVYKDTHLYDMCLKFLGEAERIAKGTKNVGLVSLVQMRAQEVKEVQAEYSKAKSAYKNIEKNQDDAEANLIVGKFLCFSRSEWEIAMPMLAKCSDKALSELAQKEAAASPDALAIGDAWSDLGDVKKDPRIRRRSVYWYERAWDSLDKVARIKIRERVKMALMNPQSGKTGLDMPPTWIRQEGDQKGIHLDDRYSRTGRLSMYLECSPTQNQPYFNTFIDVVPGASYEVSVWVMTEGQGKIVMMTHAYVNGKADIKGSCDLPLDRPFWTKLSYTVAPLPGTTKITANFVAYKSTGGHAWVDDVSIKKVGETRELLGNGSFEGK